MTVDTLSDRVICHHSQMADEMHNYSAFVFAKLRAHQSCGINAAHVDDAFLFPHQLAIVNWAVRKGRCAIFADTGLGKTRMQLAWADAIHRSTGEDVIILAPLAVSEQTRKEGADIGVAVTHARYAEDIQRGINITNYDRLHRFDPSKFGAVVLDESSIIKHHDAKTLGRLIEAFGKTPYRLCATATPAPNDWTELGTHAEFLGICSRAEMLAEYFMHDGGETKTWRLKGHARAEYWRWVASWGAMIRSPEDLGMDGSAYNLPPLHVEQLTVESDAIPPEGMLFALEAQTLSDRRQARRASMKYRIEACELLVYNVWDKLAETQAETSHALEARTRSSEESEGGCESRTKRKAHSICERQLSTQDLGTKGVHESVLRCKSGEISAENSRAAGEVQRIAQEEIRGMRRNSRGSKSCCQGMAGSEPDQTEGTKAASVRNRCGGVRVNDDETKWEMCNLRVQRHNESKDIPNGGSLPQDGGSARIVVHGVQSGDRKVQRRSGIVAQSSEVSRTPWLIWCDLNAEQDMLEKAFGDLAFSVRGSMEAEEKESAIQGWLKGDRPVMISKPSIMGWGINAQICSHIAFVGVTDSFEAYYQAIRRCWRFGQRREVYAYLFVSEQEGAVSANLARKEAAAKAMFDELSRETAAAVRDEVLGQARHTNIYAPTKLMSFPSFLGG